MSITYEVRRILETDVDNSKRAVRATIEKTMDLMSHLKPLVKIFDVTYPVWDDKHMVNLVDALPPEKSLDNSERIKIAAILGFFN